MLTVRLFARWLVAFVFTQIVEVPIYRRTLGVGFVAAFGASAITHPVVWLFLVGHLWHAAWAKQVLVVELAAWLVEAGYFRFGFGCRSTLLWSFVANAASFSLGLAARALFGWP